MANFRTPLLVKRAMVIGGLVILAIGFIAHISFAKGFGIGMTVIGLLASGGA